MRVRACLAVVAALACATPATAAAAPGDLDPSFGTRGVVELGPGTLLDLAVEPRGHVLVLGRSEAGELEVARLAGAGALDASFGDGGVARTGLGGDVGGGAFARGFAGRIFVAGVVDGRVVLARLLADGRPDPAFAGGGSTTVRLPADAQPLGPLALTQRPDGRVLLAVASTRGVVLARRAFGGAPDPAFGDGLGAVVTGVGGGSRLTFDAEGRLLLSTGTEDEGIAVLRVLPDGRPDPGFGTRGTARTPPIGPLRTGRVRGTPDGGVLATGSVVTISNDPTSILARFAPAGLLAPGPLLQVGLEDPDEEVYAYDVLEDVAALPDGRAVAVGEVLLRGAFVVLAARVLPGGALDPSFGDAGVVRGPLPGRAEVVQLTADGRAVVGVGAGIGEAPRRVVRLQGDTADLRLTTLGVPVRAGGRVTVRLRLRNAGPHPAPAAALTLARPPGAGATTDRIVADLAPGQGVTTSVELPLPAGTAGTLVAQARAVARDPTPSDARVRIRLPR